MKLTSDNMTPTACQADSVYGLDSRVLNFPPSAAPLLVGYEPDLEDIKEFYNLWGFGLWRVVLAGNNKPQKLELNSKFLKMIGLGPGDRIPSGLDDFISNFIHPDDWAEVTVPFSSCFKNTDLKIAFEHRLLNQSNGRWRWVKSIIRSRKNKQGNSGTVIFGATLDVHLLYQLLTETNQPSPKKAGIHLVQKK